jgi:hypothetical protein
MQVSVSAFVRRRQANLGIILSSPFPTATWIHEASTLSLGRRSPTTLGARNLKQGDLLRTITELPFRSGHLSTPA